MKTKRPSWQAVAQLDAPTWKLSGPQGTSIFWENSEAPLPHLKSICNFIHPEQFSPFPERLELPFPSEEILSGYEDVVSSGTDQLIHYDSNGTLVRQKVDALKAVEEFREASERRRDASSQAYRFNKFA